MTRFLFMTFSILVITTIMPVHAKAQSFTDEQKAEIKKMFDEYLENSGEQVLNSVNKYQADIQEKDRLESEKKAQSFIQNLDNKMALPMAGNPKGDVTIIEFFDYNCGYCRKALEEIQVVLKEDKNLKVIFMDMPILGPPSLEAAKWSLAAHKQGKYFEYHQAVFDHNGPKDDANLERIAKDIGLDIDQMKKDKESEEISEIIQSQIKQAQDIGIRGTPGFIIGGALSPGYIPAERIKELIAEARKNKS